MADGKDPELFDSAPQSYNEDGTPVVDGTNLIFNYLPKSLNYHQLRVMCSDYGNVVFCKIVLNRVTKESECFGFVRFEDAVSAQKCIDALNGKEMQGKRLKVSVAKPPTKGPEHANLYMAGFSATWKEEDLTALLSTFGTVKECRILINMQTKASKQAGFVRMSTHEEAVAAIKALHSLPQEQGSLTCRLADNPRESAARKAQKQGQHHYHMGPHGGFYNPTMLHQFPLLLKKRRMEMMQMGPPSDPYYRPPMQEVVPRSFRLRMELDYFEKGDPDEVKAGTVNHNISCGLGPGLSEIGFTGAQYDNQLEFWSASIIGPQSTNIGDRIYMIALRCGPSYPDQPPEVRFNTKINMPHVDQNTGRVDVRQFCPGGSWKRDMSMMTILKELYKAMTPASKLAQPARDSQYPDKW